MARPVQLRYNDAADGETVIGTYLTDDNLINDGMLKNSGSGEYTRLEVVGDKQLQENLETDYTNYGSAQNSESEPEILVYTYEKSSGDFILRDRVFPEDAGSIKDDGTYRNDNLWGFQKWVGRKRVSGISESNASITTIINSLLPSGYTAETPSGDSVPTIENYSYTGSINGALRDLIRDYPIKIWFTAELDANDDYIVKVQSKGFGGVIQTITFDNERQTEGYKINEFEPEDKSNIINKVEIVGKANDGSKIQVIESDSTSINQHGERYIKRNVGYVEDSTQATNLANSILSPDPSPHAELSIPFQEDNQLNGSVDILDNRYGIDAVYTIVKQRDFFTEGRTEVEVGFEKNRTEKRRNANRDLDERNNQLFPTDQTDVGNQSVTTGDALSNTAKEGGVGDSNDRDNDFSNVAKQGGVGDSNDRDNDFSNVAKTGNVNETFRTTTVDSASGSLASPIGSSGWTQIASVANISKDNALNHVVGYTFTEMSPTSNLHIAITVNGEAVVYHKTFQDIGGENSGDQTTALGDDFFLGDSVSFSVAGDTGSDDYELHAATQGGNSPSISGSFSADASKHSHQDDINTDNQAMGLTDDINTDNQAMGLTDDIDTVDNNHGGGTGDDQHGGSTEANVNVETATEEKTDR